MRAPTALADTARAVEAERVGTVNQLEAGFKRAELEVALFAPAVAQEAHVEPGVLEDFATDQRARVEQRRRHIPADIHPRILDDGPAFDERVRVQARPLERVLVP